MASKRKFEASELIRIPLGLLLMAICLGGIRRAIGTFEDGGMGMIIGIGVIAVSIVSLVIGAVMAFGWVAGIMRRS